MSKIALSGAGGIVGSLLRTGLRARGHDLRVAGFEPLVPLSPDEDLVHGDLREPAVVDRLLAGTEVLIHLAGTSVEKPLPEIIDNNLRALVEVYEGARRHGVRRVVFASSNHAFGMYPVEQKLRLDSEFRPDGFYGLSKAWGEAMGRLYWDKHGIEGIALRIGTCMGRPPENLRQLSTWLGTEDMLHLIERCIAAPAVGYTAVWGISNNRRAYYDLSQANAIGYRPVQDAEDWAAQILAQPDTADAVARQFQGGAFASHDYTPAHLRRGGAA
ncbi:NAD-dependent epimerase/dehydratase family protein [Xylophilus rhododendri]|uniref:NAD-dependent epimerase/dehydratase family protein n=1 Tax=Xylophilus rhododendri TaxID=2697032 RepID=A0A857J2T6_9BURK|nr:NAD(P)-dependent oxidoreductase [Xylophilus rhododendri]QHI97553.1 NAD-dependent epimerase/dehydratase family protein [Xylophilus rhododendri]